MTENKKIFLTGGAGFIGTKLCSVLSESNDVMIYDNLKRNSIQNTTLLQKPNVQLFEGDILDSNRLEDAVRLFDPDIVVHLAAIAGIDTVIRSPVHTMTVNMIGTYNVLSTLKKYAAHLDRLINLSTSEVFGSYAYKVEEESTTNLQPVGEARWTYAVSKLAGEHLAHSYYEEYGLPVVSVRPFNVYGPGQVGEGAIHQFVVRAIRNEEICVHGEGDQIRSWCYIDDLVSGLLLCMERKEAIGDFFNIGNPRGTITVSMLAQLVREIANSSSVIRYVPKTYVDVELRIPSIEKARTKLGYQPVFDLPSGLKKTIEWYRERRS